MDISAVALRILGPRATVLGADDALENYITDKLPDGAICWVTAANARYRFSLFSTATPDNVNVVGPINGPGRWIRESSSGTGLGAIFVLENSDDIPVDGTVTLLTQDIPVAADESVVIWLSARCEAGGETTADIVLQVDSGGAAFLHPTILLPAIDVLDVKYGSDLGVDTPGAGTFTYSLVGTGTNGTVSATMILIVVPTSLVTLSLQP